MKLRDSRFLRKWKTLSPLLRRLLAGSVAVLLGISVGNLGYRISVQPGAAIVKAVFEAGTEVTPPANFKQTAQAVTTTEHVLVTPPGTTPATIDIYVPEAATAPRPMVLWIHGGGFISSSPATVRDYMVMLANEGYTVASLDYTLAPGSKYPTPVQQGNAALSYLNDHGGDYGGDSSRVFIGGDSAGAQIASELAAIQTNSALASDLHITPALADTQLRGAILFCGLYDMRSVGDSGFPALRTYLWSYTGVRNWINFAKIDELSTTEQVTPDYPATFITVGDADPFAGQADELTKVLTNNRVPVTTAFWTGSGYQLPHEYQFNFSLPQARSTFTKTLEFLEREGAQR